MLGIVSTCLSVLCFSVSCLKCRGVTTQVCARWRAGGPVCPRPLGSARGRGLRPFTQRPGCGCARSRCGPAQGAWSCPGPGLRDKQHYYVCISLQSYLFASFSLCIRCIKKLSASWLCSLFHIVSLNTIPQDPYFVRH